MKTFSLIALIKLEISESVVYFYKSSDWTISIPTIVGVFYRILIKKNNGKIIHYVVQNINLEPNWAVQLEFSSGRPLAVEIWYRTVQVSTVGVAQWFYFLNLVSWQFKNNPDSNVWCWKCYHRRAAGFDLPSTYLCAGADWGLGAAQILLDEKPRRLRRCARARSEKKKE